MLRTMLKSKIHRATVTSCDLDYEGSLSLDAELMAAADIREFEQVAVADVNNGQRFETYAIAAPAGSGVVQVNGAAARLAQAGDTVIVFSYAAYASEEVERHEPLVVHVDERNAVRGALAVES